MHNESGVAHAEIERRLRELKQELATGEAQLASLDKKRRETSDTMLRIVGAISVLEEMLLASAGSEANNGKSEASVEAHRVSAAPAGQR